MSNKLDITAPLFSKNFERGRGGIPPPSAAPEQK